MLARKLTDPRSIVVIGGSNNLHKPGGKILQNLLQGSFSGDLYVVNPGEKTVQGVTSYPDPGSLPPVDLAILAIAAKHCEPVIEVLAREKETRGFIVLSAGFGEESEEGACHTAPAITATAKALPMVIAFQGRDLADGGSTRTGVVRAYAFSFMSTANVRTGRAIFLTSILPRSRRSRSSLSRT